MYVNGLSWSRGLKNVAFRAYGSDVQRRRRAGQLSLEK